MARVRHNHNISPQSPAWWRWFVIGAALLVLCSCRGQSRRSNSTSMTSGPQSVAPDPRPPAPSFRTADNTSSAKDTRTTSKFDPHVAQVSHDVPIINQPAPVQLGEIVQVQPANQALPPDCLNCGPGGAQALPHAAQPWPDYAPNPSYPWPREEYLCDGGDREVKAVVAPDWTVFGLDIEDTIGHFDTLEGDTRVEASNKVCVYAPRFAAVRKVYGIALSEGRLTPSGVEREQRLINQEHRQLITTTVQQIQPTGQRGNKSPTTFRDQTRGLLVDQTRQLHALDNSFAAYEDFQIIRFGTLKQDEKARLAQSVDAARVWETKRSVEVLIDNEAAVAQQGLAKAQVFDVYEHHGNPKMRVVKCASATSARPGDIVEFTIRFDNIGDERIGNVTIIDNLTTRLEYVPDSAQSDVEAEFYTQENEVESLVLRWEILDPLPAGQGGIIRFKCRVR